MGRWFAVDPLASKYPSMSPYNFVGNSPLIFVDPDGKVIRWAKDAESQKAKKAALELVKSSKLFAYIYSILDKEERVHNITVDNDYVQKIYRKQSKDAKGEAGGFAHPKTRDIYFANSSNSEALSEEFFHLFQFKFYENKKNVPQLDSEAKIFNQVVAYESKGSPYVDSEDPFCSVQAALCVEDNSDYFSDDNLSFMNNGSTGLLIEDMATEGTLKIESSNLLDLWFEHLANFAEKHSKDKNDPYKTSLEQQKSKPRAYNNVVEKTTKKP